MNWEKNFKDKKITVMGLGLLGRGVGDASFLAENGAKVTVTDLKNEEELQGSVEKLKSFPNVRFVLGEHRKEDFENVDMVLVAAGVPYDSEYLRHAREAGARLVQSAALFTELSRIPVIGVTGTRGKSTVTHMIHHVLSVTTGEPILLGGNVRGISNLQLLKDVSEDSIAVLELDSWQLQGFGWAGISPQIAVFTNFMPDHLNYYQKNGRSEEGAMEAYFADKANIFVNQEDSGVLVTTPEVFARAQEFAAGKKITLGQEVILADASLIPEDANLAMPGKHNRLNAALAFEALKATSLTDEEIFEGLASFPGVPGRLELIGEVNGAKVYNDNNATTPQATVQGLEAVGGDHNAVLIVGGTDKGIEIGELPGAIEKHCAHVVLYGGTGTEILKTALPAGVTYEEYDTLAECVKAAVATAASGNVILFSPAFASFGKEFKNEYDRNDQFVELIRGLE